MDVEGNDLGCFFSMDIFYLCPKNIAEDEKVVKTHIFFQHLLVLKKY